MNKQDHITLTGVLSDLEALMEFSQPPLAYLPLLKRSILRIKGILEEGMLEGNRK